MNQRDSVTSNNSFNNPLMQKAKFNPLYKSPNFATKVAFPSKKRQLSRTNTTGALYKNPLRNNGRSKKIGSPVANFNYSQVLKNIRGNKMERQSNSHTFNPRRLDAGTGGRG